MSDTESLDLRSVTDRFNESAHTLDQLRERLRALVLAEDTQGRAARALDSSAERLTALASDVQAVVEQLTAAQTTVRDALDVARSALQDADVNRLTEQIQELRNDIAGLTEVATTAQADAAQARSESASLREELSAAQADAAQSGQRLADLESKLVNVPERARRKAGLS